MPGSIELARAIKDRRLQAIADEVNVGSDPDNLPTLTLYDGVQPPNVETLVTDQQTVVVSPCSHPVEVGVVDAVLTLGPITPGVALVETVITWARLTDGAGTAMADFAVGEEGDGTAIEIAQTSVLTGVRVSILSATITEL